MSWTMADDVQAWNRLKNALRVKLTELREKLMVTDYLPHLYHEKIIGAKEWEIIESSHSEQDMAENLVCSIRRKSLDHIIVFLKRMEIVNPDLALSIQEHLKGNMMVDDEGQDETKDDVDISDEFIDEIQKLKLENANLLDHLQRLSTENQNLQEQIQKQRDIVQHSPKKSKLKVSSQENGHRLDIAMLQLKTLKSAMSDIFKLVIALHNSGKWDESIANEFGDKGVIYPCIILCTSIIKNGEDDMKVLCDSWWIIAEVAISDAQKSKMIEAGIVDLACKTIRVSSSDEMVLKFVVQTLSNISNLPILQHHLMSSQLLCLISKLSSSTNQSLSYSICRLFTNLLMSGSGAWTVAKPTRQKVINKIEKAIYGWKFTEKMDFIRHRFDGFSTRLQKFDVRVVQQMAAWSLRYFINKKASKYVPLVLQDVGLSTLQGVVRDERTSGQVRMWLEDVIAACYKYGL